MIPLLTAMLAAAWVAAVAGALALLGLARAVCRAVLDLGANLTDCTPAQGVGPWLPSSRDLAGAASEQPHHGGLLAAVQPQVHSDRPAREVRRAPGHLHATIERTWDHARGRPVLVVRPEDVA